MEYWLASIVCEGGEEGGVSAEERRVLRSALGDSGPRELRAEWRLWAEGLVPSSRFTPSREPWRRYALLADARSLRVRMAGVRTCEQRHALSDISGS